jgi:hypothetical protein
MTRYYYTDPLAAAWMSKHFGMRFATLPSLSMTPWYGLWLDGYEFKFESDIYTASKGNIRYVVHPDSLSILEPKAGDLAQIEFGLVYVNSGRGGVIHSAWMANSAPNEEYQGEMIASRILTRNGIPFMWPEKEE